LTCGDSDNLDRQGPREGAEVAKPAMLMVGDGCVVSPGAIARSRIAGTAPVPDAPTVPGRFG